MLEHEIRLEGIPDRLEFLGRPLHTDFYAIRFSDVVSVDRIEEQFGETLLLIAWKNEELADSGYVVFTSVHLLVHGGESDGSVAIGALLVQDEIGPLVVRLDERATFDEEKEQRLESLVHSEIFELSIVGSHSPNF